MNTQKQGMHTTKHVENPPRDILPLALGKNSEKIAKIKSQLNDVKTKTQNIKSKNDIKDLKNNLTKLTSLLLNIHDLGEDHAIYQELSEILHEITNELFTLNVKFSSEISSNEQQTLNTIYDNQAEITVSSLNNNLALDITEQFCKVKSAENLSAITKEHKQYYIKSLSDHNQYEKNKANLHHVTNLVHHYQSKENCDQNQKTLLIDLKKHQKNLFIQQHLSNRLTVDINDQSIKIEDSHDNLTWEEKIFDQLHVKYSSQAMKEYEEFEKSILLKPENITIQQHITNILDASWKKTTVNLNKKLPPWSNPEQKYPQEVKKKNENKLHSFADEKNGLNLPIH